MRLLTADELEVVSGGATWGEIFNDALCIGIPLGASVGGVLMAGYGFTESGVQGLIVGTVMGIVGGGAVGALGAVIIGVPLLAYQARREEKRQIF